MNENMYFYEHIGHMQFSTLTLHTYLALTEYTKGEIGFFVPWENVQSRIENFGFSKRLSYGELDRFCYGFECIDRYKDGKREIAITEIGALFLRHLLHEAPLQSGQIAFLARPAKRHDFWNVTVQETTFFNPEIYKLITEYKFRNGGARDFIKSIDTGTLLEFLGKALPALSAIKSAQNYSLGDCIAQVEQNGKYWASVGGKYSWYVYPQKFVLDFDAEDWICYDEVIKNLIRPPEWGGGKDFLYSDFLRLVRNEKRFVKFRNSGIIRPIWNSGDIKKSVLRITSPGYLMWERKRKGFVFECLIHRTAQDNFSFHLCDALDFPREKAKADNLQKTDGLPSYAATGSLEEILEMVKAMHKKQISFF